MATSSHPVLPPRGKKVIGFRAESLEYSLAEFVEKFGPSLPECVVIKQGFLGNIAEDAFDRNHVLRLCVLSRRRRIVTKANNDTYSIPISFSPRVCALNKHGKVGKEQPLDQIVDSHSLPVTIQFPRDQTITVGNSAVASNNLPNMTLIKSFDEENILGHYIVDGVMQTSVVAVPMYLTQLRVSRVVGIQGDSHGSWLRYQLQLNKQSACIEYDLEYGNPNIALYKSSAVSVKSEYTYVQPTAYSSSFRFLHTVRHQYMTTSTVTNRVHEYEYLDVDPTVTQEHLYAELQDQTTNRTTTLGQEAQFSEELKSAVTRNQTPQVPPSPLKAATSANSFRLDRAPTLPKREAIVSSSSRYNSSKEQPQNHYSNNVPRRNVPPTRQGTTVPTSHVTASRQGSTVTSSHVTASGQGTTVTSSHVTASRQGTTVTSSHVTASRQGTTVTSSHVTASRQGTTVTSSHVTASRQGTTVTSSHVTASRQGTTVTSSHVTASRQGTTVTSSHVTASRQGTTVTSSHVTTSRQGTSVPSHVTASRQETMVTSSHVTASRQGTTVPSHVTASRQETMVTSSHAPASREGTMVTSSHVTASRETNGEEKQISGVDDITDVETMTIEEVGVYLKALKLHKYVDKFQEEMVDGSILKMLDKSTLMQEFHLGTVEAIRLTKFAENGHVPR